MIKNKQMRDYTQSIRMVRIPYLSSALPRFELGKKVLDGSERITHAVPETAYIQKKAC